VRTTVRNLEREPQVRESIGREVDPGDRLAFFKADLLSDEGWAEAVAGCRYVLHVASPFPPKQPKDADELIVPAREGTLRVLKAALDAGVERVVVTSSVAAVERAAGEPADKVLTEDDWTDATSDKVSPYAKSKTLAERAAWEYVRERGAEQKLATVNPGGIIGPVLNDDTSFSIELVSRMLKGEPAVPQLGYSLVDVRDVAALEILAMKTPAAGGKRFIAANGFMWMEELARILRENLGDAAKKVPSRNAPNFLIKLMGVFDASVKSIVPQLGVRTDYSCERAKSELGWQPRPVEDSVLDTARSLIDLGIA